MVRIHRMKSIFKNRCRSVVVSFILLILFILLNFSAGFTQSPPIEPGVSQTLAQWRATRYSDVRYKLNLTLEKMSPVLKGTMEIRLKVDTAPGEQGTVPWGVPIVLDWRKIRGSEGLSTIANASVNGVNVTPLQGAGRVLDYNESTYDNRSEHLIFMDAVKPGENVIKLDFTSPILTSGSAITRYIDKEDGSEYIYSLFVPSDASTAFPVFDQPDLKARFTLHAVIPSGWKMVANNTATYWSCDGCDGDFDLDLGRLWTAETKPISTYVFAFAAGPFERVSEPPAVAGGLTQSTPNATGTKTASSTPSSANANVQPPAIAAGSDRTPSSIYVRKSQAAKFQPHAAEVFRLNRECIKYLETYFGYKFPFPKYDLVLIPEFPFGGMEHAGATFLRESSIIFPTEPTKGDHISRANLIFHEAAHQWFGDTVTMRWFDDLWLKEGFAEFMAYKTLEKVMPDANAWKVFYERNKQAAYATDSTRGTTPIYQKIDNLSAAKSAYGNIVYRKAPSFLRQAEFYLGEDKFQTAVRSFLKKHEYANAGWEDLVGEFEAATKTDLKPWADASVTKRGLPKIALRTHSTNNKSFVIGARQTNLLGDPTEWDMRFQILAMFDDGTRDVVSLAPYASLSGEFTPLFKQPSRLVAIIPNYGDYGYGIFLLDDKSRDYVLKNIGREKDPFLRSMMWGALWDSVREAELDPKVYVELAIKSLPTEQDETIVSSILGRVGTAMNYYMSDTGGNATVKERAKPARSGTLVNTRVSARSDLRERLEDVLLDRLQHAPTAGQRITFYRAFVTNASTAKGREVLKAMLAQGSSGDKRSPNAVSAGSRHSDTPLRTKDKFDIVTRLIILGDPDGLKLLADLEKTETGDDAKRYAYAARAGIASAENKAKYWSDFTANKDISESWIEAAFGPFNSVRQSELSFPYLERALIELPNHKRNRKIFFVNGWLAAFIGGQKSEASLAVVNKFLADNPNLDRDLRLKILENVDLIERAVKIRSKYSRN